MMCENKDFIINVEMVPLVRESDLSQVNAVTRSDKASIWLIFVVFCQSVRLSRLLPQVYLHSDGSLAIQP